MSNTHRGDWGPRVVVQIGLGEHMVELGVGSPYWGLQVSSEV
jgi:hypothetical protein